MPAREHEIISPEICEERYGALFSGDVHVVDPSFAPRADWYIISPTEVSHIPFGPEGRPWGSLDTLKSIWKYDIDDHAPKGSFDLEGADLLEEMIVDLFFRKEGRPAGVQYLVWSDMGSRARYTLSYDPISMWTTLEEFRGMHDVFRPDDQVGRAFWYFNSEERRRGYYRKEDSMDRELGQIVFLFSGRSSPQASFESAIFMHSPAMDQSNMDELLTKLDNAFGNRTVLNKIRGDQTL